MEQERVYRKFDEKFSKHKGTPIALYGLGIHTKHLLEEAKDYNIVGIVANDRIGECIYGNEVLSVKDIENKAAIIIIVAQTKSVKLIYNRIKYVEEKGITIYDVSGEKISDSVADWQHDSKNNQYWNSTFEQLKDKIDNHDIISFDVFDTLIMRKLLMPEQIWDAMELEVATMEGNYKIDFKNERIKAEQQLGKQGITPTIREIYNVLSINTGLSEHWSQWLMNKEFETEKKYVTERNCLVAALEYARIQGKRIFIITDTHLSSSQIYELLLQCSITNIDTTHMFVSSEIKKTKSDGSLYEFFINKVGSGSKLHIGANKFSDIEVASQMGMDTYYVMSAYEMFKNSSAYDVIAQAASINDHAVLGLFAAQAFNNPFSLSPSKGKLEIKSMNDLGYYCFAPITLKFVTWMVDALKNNAKSVILFSSRDGYFLYKVYQEFRLKYEHLNLPEAVYFYISRRALTVAAIQTEDDIIDIIQSVLCLSVGNLGEILEQRLGITFDKTDEMLNRSLIAVMGDEDRSRIVARVLEYREGILENSSVERMNFLNYIQNKNLYSYENIVLFDLYTKGTSLYKLRQLMNRDIELICYSLKDFPNTMISARDNIKSLFEDQELLSNSWFERSYQLFEVVYSSSEGQLECFNDQLEPQFVKNSEYNYEYIKEAQAGILEFLNQLECIDPNWYTRSISLKMADSISRLMTQKHSITSEDIHKGFSYYDSFASEKTTNIWDNII